jgi:streptogramin lyase
MIALVGLAPVVTATAIAGILTRPEAQRPCAVEYSKGLPPGILHLTVGADGDLYATEGLRGHIVRFDPNTHRATSFALAPGTPAHDIEPGPDGRIWFDTLNDKLGALDLHTGQITMYPGLTPGSQPHSMAWSGGQLYIPELLASRLARFDLNTHTLVEGAFGLPPGSQIHTIIATPDGNLWATLSALNELARFNPRAGRFDKFVPMPIAQSGPRDLTYLASENAIYFTMFAANAFGRYDLSSGAIALYPTTVKPVPLAVALPLTGRYQKLTIIHADVAHHAMWASTLGPQLERLDLRTHKVTLVHCGINFPAVTAGIASDHKGQVWFNEAVPGRIARIQP